MQDSRALEGAGDITASKYLGVVGTTVVGISYRFCAAADPKGLRVNSLARLLNDVGTDEDGMVVVLLKRAKNIPADPNAVSVLMGPGAKGLVNHSLLQGKLILLRTYAVDSIWAYSFFPTSSSNWSLLLVVNDDQEKTYVTGYLMMDREAYYCIGNHCIQVSLLVADMGRDSSSPLSSPDGCIQVGFLPRKTAVWVAPLWDGGLCTFMARIWPQEALSIASGVSEGFVRLALYIFEVCTFFI